MFSFNKIALYFLLLFIFSCNNDINNFKRIQGNALGTSYSIIVDTDIKEHSIKEKIDSIFEVINNSMSTYMDSSIISKVNLSSISKKLILSTTYGIDLLLYISLYFLKKSFLKKNNDPVIK